MYHYIREKMVYKPNYITENLIKRMRSPNPGPISKYIKRPIFSSYPPENRLLTLEDFISAVGTPRESENVYMQDGRLAKGFAFALRVYNSYSRLAKDVANVLPEPYSIEVLLKEKPLNLVTLHRYRELWCYGNGIVLSTLISVYTDPQFFKKYKEKIKERQAEITLARQSKNSGHNNTILEEAKELKQALDRASFYINLLPFFQEMEEAYTAMLALIKEEGRLPKNFSFKTS